MCRALLSNPYRYAVAELQKDVEREIQALPEAEREAARTKFGIFVVHNKRKTKLGTIPDDVKYAISCLAKMLASLMRYGCRYFQAAETEDVW